MIIADTALLEAQDSRALITSRINRTLTICGVMSAIADRMTQTLVAFDECALFLRDERGGDFQVWHATPAGGLQSTKARNVLDPPAVVREAMHINRVRVVSANNLTEADALAPDIRPERLRSAVVFPLSIENESFGALVFVSAIETYARGEMIALRWFADHIAVAIQASLLRERLKIQEQDEAGFIESLKTAFLHALMRDVRLPLTSVVASLQSVEDKTNVPASNDKQNGEESLDPEESIIEKRFTPPRAYMPDETWALRSAVEHARAVCRAVDDHFDIARGDERRLELNREIISLDSLLKHCTELVTAEASLRGIEIKCEMFDDARLRIDVAQISRALAHLLNIAVAATQDGGCVSVETHREAAQTASHPARPIVSINIHHFSLDAAACETELSGKSLWQATPEHRIINPNLNFAVAERIANAHDGALTIKAAHGLEIIYSLTLPVCES